MNRPPTPDVRDDDEDDRPKEPTLLEIVNIKVSLHSIFHLFTFPFLCCYNDGSLIFWIFS